MSVADLTTTYQYLLAVLIGLPAVVAAFVAFRDQWRMMWLSGLAFSAVAPLGAYYNDSYFTPVRLGNGPIGVEDFMMAFSIGSLVWVAGVLPFRRLVTVSISSRRFAFRFLIVFVGVSVLLNVLQLGGLSIMTASLIVQLVCIVVLLQVRPEYWRFAASCIVLYTPYYCAILYLTSLIADGFFFNLWNGTALWSSRFFGLPIQELLWALSFPPSYVLAMAYAAEARITHAASTGRQIPGVR